MFGMQFVISAVLVYITSLSLEHFGLGASFLRPHFVLLSVCFGLLMFFSWALIARGVFKSVLGQESLGGGEGKRGKGVTMSGMLLKVALFASLFLFLKGAEREGFLSFLLGFTVFLFVGMVLTLWRQPKTEASKRKPIST